MGADVCKVVKDFFSTGKLLKQVNATVITIIPQVQSPMSAGQFRPIACCNVIYQCISKLLCNRIGRALPSIANCN